MSKKPGEEAIKAMKTLHSDLIFKTPIEPVRKRREKILDEETYVEKMGEIIQRDFFPDLEQLKAQNEYLEATEKNDTVKMRQLYMKYNGSKPSSTRIPSPATFETPQREPELQPLKEAEPLEPKLSLDQFLHTHTSQDNQSFNDIVDEMEAKHREKYAYLFNSESQSYEVQKAQLTLPTIESQALEPIKQLNVDTWTYKNRNYIMYTPDGVALTRAQQIEAKKTSKRVVHGNTRLMGCPFDAGRSKETIHAVARTQTRAYDGRIGVDGKELLAQGGGGADYVRSPAAGQAAGTPLMTWGAVEGTPFRLDETPGGAAFRMAGPARRERLALALAEGVGVRNRVQRERAAAAARRRFATPSPRRGTASPATPAATPRRGATPKLNLGIRRAGDDHLTDDLLRIELPKRQKAADFF